MYLQIAKNQYFSNRINLLLWCIMEMVEFPVFSNKWLRLSMFLVDDALINHALHIKGNSGQLFLNLSRVVESSSGN